MNKSRLKMAAISALRAEPDFSQLRLLRTCSSREMRAFWRWLDVSGLALYLYARLRDSEELQKTPPDFQHALRRRLQANCDRVEDMLGEFTRVNEAFASRGVRHVFLKGFTLAPRFCPDVALRFQTDIDILVPPDGVADAAQALRACGYVVARSRALDQMYFSTPRQTVPSAEDDFYQLQPHREAELHTSLWEGAEAHHVKLKAPGDCLDRKEFRELKGVHFLSLSTEDMFLLQVLHAFSHLLGSWVRMSWFWELHYFIQNNQRDEQLWLKVRARAGDDPVLRNACGLIVRLVERLFGGAVPPLLAQWCSDPLPERMNAWVNQFGVRWALADMSGNKLTLFIHKEFMSDPRLWKSYLLRRILPVAGRPSIGEIEARDTKTRLIARIAQFSFACQRLVFHARALAPLSVDLFRWKYALQANRNRRAATGGLLHGN